MTSEKPGTFRVSPHVLTDGGVYDNTGFESAALLDAERQKTNINLSDLILVSDAGSSFQWSQAGEFTNPLSLAQRSSEIMMNRVAEATLRRIASNGRVELISIDRIVDQNFLPPTIQKYISRIRTDLDKFSDIEVATLVAYGENKAIGQLAGRYQIDPNSTELNQFPLSLPTSSEEIAKALKGSGRIKWWNTFTNLSDFFPTVIINTAITLLLIFAMFFIYLSFGAVYLWLITPLRTQIVVTSNTVEQGATTLEPLDSPKNYTKPELKPLPTVNSMRVDRCLEAIDTNLSFDEVQRQARRCAQLR